MLDMTPQFAGDEASPSLCTCNFRMDFGVAGRARLPLLAPLIGGENLQKRSCSTKLKTGVIVSGENALSSIFCILTFLQ